MKWQHQNSEIEGPLILQAGKQTYRFYVEVKREVKTNTLPRLLQQAKEYRPLLVIAESIPPKARTVLQEANIAYLTTQGNAYLNEEGLLVFMDAPRKPATNTGREKAPFTGAEVKLIYQLLLKEGLLQHNYRDLARETETALGSLTPLFQKLEHRGFLVQEGSRKVLKNKEALISEWTAAYGITLHTDNPENARFRFADKNKDWKTLELQRQKSWWGGEPAANLLTQYLQPRLLTLYSREEYPTLLRQYRLIPDPQGELIIRTPFWPQTADLKNNTVPPLLVYADLILTDDYRCIETANLIYETILAPQFRKITR